jgi:CHAD domain-containing protein
MSRQIDRAPTARPVKKRLARRIARLERRVRGVAREERRRARRLEQTHHRRMRFEARLLALRETLGRAGPGGRLEEALQERRTMTDDDTTLPAVPPRRRPGVAAADTVSVAGRKMLRFHLRRLRARVTEVRRGEDPEAIHDARVATRRLRAAWQVFDMGAGDRSTRSFERDLRRLGRRLGAVRDLDVLLAGAVAYQAELPDGEAAALGRMLATWREERASAQRRLRRALASRRYRRFVDDFRDWLRGEPVAEQATGAAVRVRHRVASRVWGAYEPVWAFEGPLEAADLVNLHRLRIAAKHLRYTLEAFGEVLPGADALLAAVAGLQNHLGTLHDANVAAAKARAYAASRRGPLAGIERGSVEAFIASRQGIVTRQRASLATPWSAVVGPSFRAALYRALAAADEAV